MPKAPQVGEIIRYTLTHRDVEAVEHARLDSSSRRYGNKPRTGDVVPLVVVRVWPDEYRGVNNPICDGSEVLVYSPVGVNGQAILDGNDSLWITSAPHARAPGCWCFPEEEF